jgi:hypothetical protein
MKKLVVVLAVAFSGLLNAQSFVNDIVNELIQEQKIRYNMSNYVADSNLKAEYTLYNLVTNRLNIDSLLAAQPHLVRVKVNQYWTGHKSIDIIPFFKSIDFDKYKDTSKFKINYFSVDESVYSFRSETISIVDLQTNKDLVGINLQYEPSSNMIHNIIEYTDNFLNK